MKILPNDMSFSISPTVWGYLEALESGDIERVVMYAELALTDSSLSNAISTIHEAYVSDMPLPDSLSRWRNPPDLNHLRSGHDSWRLWRNSFSSPPDLRYTDLRGLTLSRFDLSNANLQGAKLDGAVLVGANLAGANLKGASLRGVDLSHASLRHAFLDDADLSNSRFFSTNLSHATLRYADLSNSSFIVSNLRHANLLEVFINNSTFNQSDFSFAEISDSSIFKSNFFHVLFERVRITKSLLLYSDFIYSIFPNSVIEKSNLSFTSFSSSCLPGIRLSDVNLHCSRLSNVDLRGSIHENVDFSGADFTSASLNAAHMKNVTFGGSIFRHTKLDGIKGLESCTHIGSNSIDYKTKDAYPSLPEHFLSQCNVNYDIDISAKDRLPDDEILDNSYLPILSCYVIEYHSSDRNFALRLRTELSSLGFCCQLREFRSIDSDPIYDNRSHSMEKVILCLSENSLKFWWSILRLRAKLMFGALHHGSSFIFPILVDELGSKYFAGDVDQPPIFSTFSGWENDYKSFKRGVEMTVLSLNTFEKIIQTRLNALSDTDALYKCDSAL